MFSLANSIFKIVKNKVEYIILVRIDPIWGVGLVFPVSIFYTDLLHYSTNTEIVSEHIQFGDGAWWAHSD
jgi:hypothetical protein